MPPQRSHRPLTSGRGLKQRDDLHAEPVRISPAHERARIETLNLGMRTQDLLSPAHERARIETVSHRLMVQDGLNRPLTSGRGLKLPRLRRSHINVIIARSRAGAD